jgi:hypothetical protein
LTNKELEIRHRENKSKNLQKEEREDINSKMPVLSKMFFPPIIKALKPRVSFAYCYFS